MLTDVSLNGHFSDVHAHARTCMASLNYDECVSFVDADGKPWTCSLVGLLDRLVDDAGTTEIYNALAHADPFSGRRCKTDLMIAAVNLAQSFAFDENPAPVGVV